MSWLKSYGLPIVPIKKLQNLRIDRGAGTAGVVIKYVDISWNTDGEGKHLGFSLTLRHES